MERAERRDGRPPARQTSRMGRDDRSGARPGVQHRQWRHLPLELDVAAARQLVRPRSGAPFDGERIPLEVQLADAAPIWAEIARKHGLVESDLSVVASAWHTDADLGRPIEVVTDMTKSRKLGFLDYQATDDSFFDLFARLRADRVIP
ncbi:protein of unknown function [Methylocella tundrae]|uniref:Uncharacterized protein n=1 Tax=Methylocella tundrae TaxID=227605 RepID=A0A4U8YVZ3_METTU|nr:protein of unknown function [Methylocella tundrae]